MIIRPRERSPSLSTRQVERLPLATLPTPFSGGLTIKAGSVVGNSSQAGEFGLGGITLGDITGSANASLTYGGSTTIAQNIVVAAGSSGNTLTIQVQTNSASFIGTVALNNNLTVDKSHFRQDDHVLHRCVDGGRDQRPHSYEGDRRRHCHHFQRVVVLGTGGLTFANSGATTFTLSGGITSATTGSLTRWRQASNGTGAITVSTNSVNTSGAVTNSGPGPERPPSAAAWEPT